MNLYKVVLYCLVVLDICYRPVASEYDCTLNYGVFGEMYYGMLCFTFCLIVVCKTKRSSAFRLDLLHDRCKMQLILAFTLNVFEISRPKYVI